MRQYVKIVLTTLVVGLIGVASAQTFAAWGRISFDPPQASVSVRYLNGVPNGLTISMNSVRGSYSRSISSAQAPTGGATYRSNEFGFANPPFGENIYLQIEWNNPLDPLHSRCAPLQITYRFSRPELNFAQALLHRQRAFDAAGYMGDFVVNLNSGCVTRGRDGSLTR